ncbi:MAG: RNA polymerase sigma factor [Lachnospiraceae bacterium]|nr:RNA polymerase sigma factor [Lachnospiraceae bacterium]
MSLNIEEQYDKIYRYCYFKLHHQQTAEDITQETFLRYFHKYGGAAREEPLKYLYTIAKNLCIDEYRRQSVQKEHEFARTDFAQDNLAPGEHAQRNTMPSDSQEEQILTNMMIRAALSELTFEEQELLLLRYVNEVPVSVIARMFDLSRYAVRRRLIAVKRKFRNILEKWEGAE